MASSSSSADPHLQNSKPSSSSKPLTSPSPQSPSPSPSPPPSLYTAQSLPTKSPNPTPHPQIPKIQGTQGVLYPVSSSGRPGFIPNPKSFRPKSPDQLVTVANPNPGGFPPRSIPNQARPYGFPPSDPKSMRPPMMHPSQLGLRSTTMAGGGGGAPPFKTSPSIAAPKAAGLFPSSAPDFNGYRDPRDASRDDTVATVRDRKVRLSDGDSLYALCRSWVRNGLPKGTQPQFVEGLKLLPRPPPAAVTDTHMPDGDENGDKEEDIGSVEHLSAHGLLQIHVKRAKRVRARLRKERLEKIGRYRERLSLLLPPRAEHFIDDTTGN